MFSYKTRDQNIQKLSESFDIAIIGGGVVGAGIAKEASLRGMKTVLVEAKNFGQGTSSKSSKLMHGGLRYLEQLNFSLVFKSLQARDEGIRDYPDLVSLQPFHFVKYANDGHNFFKLHVGLSIYDLFSFFSTPQLHGEVAPTALPYFLKQKGLEGALSYYDAYMDDVKITQRLIFEAHSAGATCINYFPCQKINFKNDTVTSLECIDTLSQGAQFVSVKAKYFVSALGIWGSNLRSLFYNESDSKLFNSLKESKSHIVFSKGVHLVFSKERIPILQPMVFYYKCRTVFVMPRKKCVIVGTTETAFRGSLNSVFTEYEDARYLLEMLNFFYPQLELTEKDCTSSYAGIRPLVAQGDMNDLGTLSRDHQIWQEATNLSCIGGGKFTTYKEMSLDMVENCLSRFSIDDVEKFSTRCEHLPSKWSQPGKEWLAQTHLDETLAVRIYEAIYFEMCCKLLDFYNHHSSLFLQEGEKSLELLEEIADILCRELGWSKEMRQTQIDEVKAYIHRELSWKAEF